MAEYPKYVKKKQDRPIMVFIEDLLPTKHTKQRNTALIILLVLVCIVLLITSVKLFVYLVNVLNKKVIK